MQYVTPVQSGARGGDRTHMALRPGGFKTGIWCLRDVVQCHEMPVNWCYLLWGPVGSRQFTAVSHRPVHILCTRGPPVTVHRGDVAPSKVPFGCNGLQGLPGVCRRRLVAHNPWSEYPQYDRFARCCRVSSHRVPRNLEAAALTAAVDRGRLIELEGTSPHRLQSAFDRARVRDACSRVCPWNGGVMWSARCRR